jgi:hypothetical protein
MAEAGKIKAIDIAAILKKERIINSSYQWAVVQLRRLMEQCARGAFSI